MSYYKSDIAFSLAGDIQERLSMLSNDIENNTDDPYLKEAKLNELKTFGDRFDAIKNNFPLDGLIFQFHELLQQINENYGFTESPVQGQISMPYYETDKVLGLAAEIQERLVKFSNVIENHSDDQNQKEMKLKIFQERFDEIKSNLELDELVIHSQQLLQDIVDYEHTRNSEVKGQLSDSEFKKIDPDLEKQEFKNTENLAKMLSGSRISKEELDEAEEFKKADSDVENSLLLKNIGSEKASSDCSEIKKENSDDKEQKDGEDEIIINNLSSQIEDRIDKLSKFIEAYVDDEEQKTMKQCLQAFQSRFEHSKKFELDSKYKSMKYLLKDIVDYGTDKGVGDKLSWIEREVSEEEKKRAEELKKEGAEITKWLFDNIKRE